MYPSVFYSSNSTSIAMDPFSHYMIAYFIGKRLKVEHTALLAITLGAWLPDIDAFSIVLGVDAFSRMHGTFTHSLFMPFILAELLAIVFLLYHKRFMLHYIYGGCLIHLATDMALTGSYPLLFPFTNRIISIDPYISFEKWIWAVNFTLMAVGSLVYFIYLLRKGEYPWRIWFDERIFLRNFGKYLVKIAKNSS